MEMQVTPMAKPQFVEVLRHYGCRSVTVEKIEEHIAAGAPVNADGTVNIVHYTAWLLKELCHGE